MTESYSRACGFTTAQCSTTYLVPGLAYPSRNRRSLWGTSLSRRCAARELLTPLYSSTCTKYPVLPVNPTPSGDAYASRSTRYVVRSTASGVHSRFTSPTASTACPMSGDRARLLCRAVQIGHRAPKAGRAELERSRRRFRSARLALSSCEASTLAALRRARRSSRAAARAARCGAPAPASACRRPRRAARRAAARATRPTRRSRRRRVRAAWSRARRRARRARPPSGARRGSSRARRARAGRSSPPPRRDPPPRGAPRRACGPASTCGRREPERHGSMRCPARDDRGRARSARAFGEQRAALEQRDRAGCRRTTAGPRARACRGR